MSMQRGVVSHGETKLVGADCEHLRMDLMQQGPSQSTTSQNTQKRKCQKILLFRHFFKETD